MIFSIMALGLMTFTILKFSIATHSETTMIMIFAITAFGIATPKIQHA
jgi:hypothetical protein